MVKQFVDHFKVKDFGFNFFPVLGLIIAAVMVQCFREVFYALKNLLQHGAPFTFQLSPVMVFFPLFFGLGLVWLAHRLKDDILFIVFFGPANVVLALFSRLISYHAYSYGEYFYKDIRLSALLFNARNLLGTFIYGLSVALALVVMYRLFKRLDYAILMAFPLAEFINILFYVTAEVFTGGKISFDNEWYLLALIDGALNGFFFYLGYALYMRARGLKVSGGKVRPAGEATAPRTNLLSQKFFFGMIAGSIFLDLVFMFLILSFVNYRRMQLHPQAGVFEGGHWLGSFIILIVGLAGLNLLLSAVLYVVFVLRMWTSLQDGRAGTSPALAAGLLFVPGFNLYWLFRVFYGFALDHNALVDRQRLNVPKLPASLYLTFSILAVANFLVLPFSGLTRELEVNSLGFGVLALVSLFQAVVALAVVFLTCQAVNRIPAEVYRRPQPVLPKA